MKNFILEFSEKQQCFHYNDGGKGQQVPETFGWTTIIESIDTENAMKFEEIVENLKGKKPLKTSFVKHCASLFMLGFNAAKQNTPSPIN